MTRDRPAARPPAAVRPVPLALWTGGPFVLAGLHLVAGYTIVSLYCLRGWADGTVAGLPLVRVLMLGLTAVIAALVVAAMVATVRGHRRLEDPGVAADDPRASRRFLLFGALLIDGLVLVYLVGSAVLILVVEPC